MRRDLWRLSFLMLFTLRDLDERAFCLLYLWHQNCTLPQRFPHDNVNDFVRLFLQFKTTQEHFIHSTHQFIFFNLETRPWSLERGQRSPIVLNQMESSTTGKLNGEKNSNLDWKRVWNWIEIKKGNQQKYSTLLVVGKAYMESMKNVLFGFPLNFPTKLKFGKVPQGEMLKKPNIPFFLFRTFNSSPIQRKDTLHTHNFKGTIQWVDSVANFRLLNCTSFTVTLSEQARSSWALSKMKFRIDEKLKYASIKKMIPRKLFQSPGDAFLFHVYTTGTNLFLQSWVCARCSLLCLVGRSNWIRLCTLEWEFICYGGKASFFQRHQTTKFAALLGQSQRWEHLSSANAVFWSPDGQGHFPNCKMQFH